MTFLTPSILARTLSAAIFSSAAHAQLSISDPGQDVFNFSAPTGELSGLSWLAADSYQAVSERRSVTLRISLNPADGRISAASQSAASTLATSYDLEGIAWCPPRNSFFISDEGQWPVGGHLREFLPDGSDITLTVQSSDSPGGRGSPSPAAPAAIPSPPSTPPSPSPNPARNSHPTSPSATPPQTPLVASSASPSPHPDNSPTLPSPGPSPGKRRQQVPKRHTRHRRRLVTHRIRQNQLPAVNQRPATVHHIRHISLTLAPLRT